MHSGVTFLFLHTYTSNDTLNYLCNYFANSLHYNNNILKYTFKRRAKQNSPIYIYYIGYYVHIQYTYTLKPNILLQQTNNR